VTVTAVASVAATVKVVGLPGDTAVGLAEIVTVGFATAFTVTEVDAVAEPPGPFAVAVYVVVAAGLTDFVPPFPDRVKLLLSVPVTVTDSAFVAATVSVEALPAVTEVGLAEIDTVGLAAGPELCETPHPVEIRSREKHVTVAIL